MEYLHIEIEQTEPIATIWLNRPEYRNAQSRVMLEEITDAFAQLDQDRTIKVIILAGKGEHFSSGHDLGTPEELEDRENSPFSSDHLGRLTRSWHLYVENSLRWRDVKKPTIAAVEGYCIFGGYLVATCMDLIIASTTAQFLPSHLQLFSAPWDLGVRNAKKILFEGRFIGASEAKELGLVQEVVSEGAAYSAAFDQALKFAEQDLLWLRMLKQSINSAQDSMGYRLSVESAHSNYMMLELSESIKFDGTAKSKPRLEGVAAAIKRERRE